MRTNKKPNDVSKELPDVQKMKDRRGIPINRVGVSNIDFPIYIKTKKGEKKVLCYANVNLYGSLHHNVKGTNMSRFIESLMKYRYTSFSRWVIWKFLYDLKRKTESNDVYIEVTFKYFIDKKAPVSKRVSTMAYNCTFIGKLSNNKYTFNLKVAVPITSLCPCSKEMSKYGAHNQRGTVTVTVEPKRKGVVWIEDLIKLVEQEGSCELYPVLKRPDEKYVTERAFENPKFVEDIARDVAGSLQKLKALRRFKIKVENYESIHAHNAVCYIERVLKGLRWRQAYKSLRKLSDG